MLDPILLHVIHYLQRLRLVIILVGGFQVFRIFLRYEFSTSRQKQIAIWGLNGLREERDLEINFQVDFRVFALLDNMKCFGIKFEEMNDVL